MICVSCSQASSRPVEPEPRCVQRSHLIIQGPWGPADSGGPGSLRSSLQADVRLEGLSLRKGPATLSRPGGGEA